MSLPSCWRCGLPSRVVRNASAILGRHHLSASTGDVPATSFVLGTSQASFNSAPSRHLSLLHGLGICQHARATPANALFASYSRHRTPGTCTSAGQEEEEPRGAPPGTHRPEAVQQLDRPEYHPATSSATSPDRKHHRRDGEWRPETRAIGREARSGCAGEVRFKSRCRLCDPHHRRKSLAGRPGQHCGTTLQRLRRDQNQFHAEHQQRCEAHRTVLPAAGDTNVVEEAGTQHALDGGENWKEERSV